MTNGNSVLAAPKHDCGDVFVRKPVRIWKDGHGYDWGTNYCVRCEAYVYGLPDERFETNDPAEMGKYITEQISLGKRLYPASL